MKAARGEYRRVSGLHRAALWHHEDETVRVAIQDCYGCRLNGRRLDAASLVYDLAVSLEHPAPDWRAYQEFVWSNPWIGGVVKGQKMTDQQSLTAEQWERIARYLFDLLDDIDTAADMAKGNDAAYREFVGRIHVRRFEVAQTDGYTVTFGSGDPITRA